MGRIRLAASPVALQITLVRYPLVRIRRLGVARGRLLTLLHVVVRVLVHGCDGKRRAGQRCAAFVKHIFQRQGVGRIGLKTGAAISVMLLFKPYYWPAVRLSV